MRRRERPIQEVAAGLAAIGPETGSRAGSWLETSNLLGEATLLRAEVSRVVWRHSRLISGRSGPACAGWDRNPWPPRSKKSQRCANSAGGNHNQAFPPRLQLSRYKSSGNAAEIKAFPDDNKGMCPLGSQETR